jgi:hypothetical protein
MSLSTTDVEEFVNCWQETMDRSSIIRPYNVRREALVLSFDDELNPFLNYTKGYHYPKGKRFYFETVPKVIRDIGKRLGPYRGTGGRVFIDNQRAYYVDELLIRTDLCELSWPENRDVIAEIRGYWSASRRRATMILTKVKWN